MDKLTPEQRRRCMQAVKGRDTLPEVIVRKWLHAHGFRFRVCDKRIVGYPDVVLPKLKTLILPVLPRSRLTELIYLIN